MPPPSLQADHALPPNRVAFNAAIAACARANEPARALATLRAMDAPAARRRGAAPDLVR